MTRSRLQLIIRSSDLVFPPRPGSPALLATLAPLVTMVLLAMVGTADAATSLNCGLATNGGGLLTNGSTTIIGSVGQEVVGYSHGVTHVLRHGAWPCCANVVVGVPGEGPDPKPVEALSLGPGLPTPFGSTSGETTLLHFHVPEDAGAVTLRIYDINARLVRTLINDSEWGARVATWNGMDEAGSRVASGVYYAVLRSRKDKAQSRKLVYLK